MRKIVLILLVALIVLLTPVLVSDALADDDASSRLALDLVIVIDRSTTMKSNDPYGYRYDAAMMLIGLCDSENSRVSVVPFSTTVFVDSKRITQEIRDNCADLFNWGNDLGITRFAGDLYDISLSSGNRTQIVDMLSSSDRNTWDDGKTALGKALMYAVNMLTVNSSDNKPVIVLLTDGDIDTDDNVAEQTIYNEAVVKAKDAGIKVYTVSLKDDENAKTLLYASAQTGAMKTESVKQAEDLPAVFNKFFADMIGSESVELESNTSTNDDGSQSVYIEVPNKSVAEMNILVPVGTRYNGSVNLYKPNSAVPVEIDNTNVCMYSTQYFTFIKCIEPGIPGQWRVDYSSNINNALSDTSVKVLFSYSVKPEITVSASPIYKMEDLGVTVQFLTSNGDATKDNMLYNGNINAVMTVFDSKGKEVSSEPIQLDKRKDSFYTSVKPSEIIPDLKSGDYSLTIYLEGDGMDDSAELKIHIENKGPETITITDNPFNDKKVADPTTPEYTKPYIATINLNELFVEPDNEAMRFTVIDNEGGIVTYQSQIVNGNLELTTTGKTGTGSVTIEATDPENATNTIKIPVKVTNVKDYIADNYVLRITGKATQKAETYEYTAQLFDGESIIVRDDAQLSLVEIGAQLNLDYTHNDDEAIGLKFDFDADRKVWVCKVTTSRNECNYSVTANARLKDIEIKTDSSKCSFTLENTEPRLIKSSVSAYNDIRIHDPLTDDFEVERECMVNINDYVTDDDGQKLTYTVKEVTGDADAIVYNTAIGSDGIFKFSTNDKTGSATVTIKVTDEDEASVELNIPVSVTSIRNTIQNTYRLDITVDHEPQDANEEYTYKAQLYDGDKQVTDERYLSIININAVRTTKYGSGKSDEQNDVRFVRAENAAEFTANSVTGKDTASYTIKADVTLRNIPITANGITVGNGNREPVVDKQVTEFKDIVIHNPLTSDYDEEYVKSINLNDYMHDPDNQELRFEIAQQADDQTAIVTVDARTGMLTVKSNNRTGSTNVVIVASDGDGANQKLMIPINIECRRDYIAQNYTVKVTGRTEDKSSEYTYTAVLYDKNEQVTDTDILGKVSLNLYRSVDFTADELRDIENESLIFSREGSVWTAKARTNNHECTYTVSAESNIRGIQLKTAGDSFTLKNVEPTRTSRNVSEYGRVEIHDPIDTDKYEYEKEAEITLTLADYFTDKDGEELVYTWNVTGDTDAIKDARITDGNFLFSTNHKTGSVEFTVTASDPQGASVDLKVPVSIIDKAEEIEKTYSLVVRLEKNPTDKNAEYTYIARLYDNGIEVDDNSVLKHVEITAAQVYTYSNGKPEGKEKLSFRRVEGSACWEAIMTTDIDACDYTVEVNATLRKDIRLTTNADECAFTLQNKVPELKDEPANPFNKQLVINDPNPKNGSNAGEFDNRDNMLDLNTWAFDPDTQLLNFVIIGNTDPGIADADIRENIYLKVKTKSTTGSTQIKLKAVDPDGGEVEFSIDVNVFDRADYIADNYVLEFEAEEGVEKNSDYSYSMKLVDVTGEDIEDAAVLNGMLTMEKNSAYVDYNGSKLYLTTFDNNAMTVGCASKEKAGSYTVMGTVKLNGIDIKVKDNGFTVENIAPAVNAEYAETLPAAAAIDPWLWAKKDDSEFTVDLAQLFTDSATDVLTFNAAELPAATENAVTSADALLSDYLGNHKTEVTAVSTEAQESASVQTDDNEAAEVTTEPAIQEAGLNAADCVALSVVDGILTVANTEKGDRRLLLWAADADGEMAAYLFSYSVSSQKDDIIQMLIYAAIALAALIVIIILYYWLIFRKSWTEAHGKSITMTVVDTQKANQKLPVTGKSDVGLGSQLSISAGKPAMYENANCYKLRAGKDSTAKVKRVKKPDSGEFKVKVQGNEVGTKWVEWDINTTLVVDDGKTKVSYRRNAR